MIHDAPVRAVDASQPESPMRAQLGTLDSRIDVLTHNIERLKHRLDDVLRTPTPEPSAQIEESAKAGPLDASYALLELDRMTAKINDLSFTIEDICNRLVT